MHGIPHMRTGKGLVLVGVAATSSNKRRFHDVQTSVERINNTS